MEHEAVRLSAEKPGGTKLVWVVRGGASYRLYEHGPADTSAFCVSTRSTEVIVVLDGEMRLELGPKRQELQIGSGGVAVVARGTPHHYWVRGRTTTLIVDLGEPLPRVGCAAGGAARRLVGLAERLARHELRLGTPDIVEAARDASSRLDRNLEIERVQSSGLMQRVRASLERAHVEPISLESTARRHGIDPFYLSRAFKRNFGVPPQRYLQFLRTEHFVWNALLAAGRAPDLGRAALDAGFGDYATFSKRMRSLFGKPPSALFDRL